MKVGMGAGITPIDSLRRRALRLGGIVAVATIVLDQVSKWWMLAHVMDPPRVIEVTPFFNLVYAWNRGISFGVFNTDAGWNRWILPLVALAICVALAVWLARSTHWITTVGLAMIIGGAVGNVVDRLRFGAVYDFLDVHAAGWHWPAFNVADSAISVGVLLLILDSLFAIGERRTSKAWKENAGKREPTG
jgi:signal peptidase II